MAHSVADEKPILLINLDIEVHIHDLHFLDRFAQEVDHILVLILDAVH